MREYLVAGYSYLFRQWTVKRVYANSESEAVKQVKSEFDEIRSVREA